MTDKKDIFDRIMSLPLLRPLNGFYVKNKSALLYIFFGGLTTVISIASFILFDSVVGLYVRVANLLSWVLAVMFAYITNRTWVFESKAKGAAVFGEMGSFFLGRVATLVLEDVIIAVFIDCLGFNSTIVKIAAQFSVFISNYLLSKFIVFKKKL